MFDFTLDATRKKKTRKHVAVDTQGGKAGKKKVPPTTLLVAAGEKRKTYTCGREKKKSAVEGDRPLLTVRAGERETRVLLLYEEGGGKKGEGQSKKERATEIQWTKGRLGDCFRSRGGVMHEREKGKKKRRG